MGKMTGTAMALALGIVLVLSCACGSGSSEPGDQSTPTSTAPTGLTPATSTANAEISCADDVKMIQSALDDYYKANRTWPTAGGRAGDIQWSLLIPGYLSAVPASDAACDWQANSAPEGTVCLWDKGNKGSNCACGSACTGQPGTTPESTVAVTKPPPTPTEPPECETDRIDMKAAIDAYQTAKGEWPTADGKPGLIVWEKIVPSFLKANPSTIKCKWQVNSDPLGEVCRSVHC